MTQLKQDLAALKPVQRVNKYYVSLPTQEAHRSHPIGPGVAGFAQKMHPKIADKICELVSEGTTAVPEIRSDGNPSSALADGAHAQAWSWSRSHSESVELRPCLVSLVHCSQACSRWKSQRYTVALGKQVFSALISASE